MSQIKCNQLRALLMFKVLNGQCQEFRREKQKKIKQEMSNFEHRPVANLQDRGIKQKYNEKFALAVRLSFVKDVSKRSLQPRRCFHGDMIYRFNWQQ